MKDNFDIQDRSPIWIALSEFYLDTDLQDIDFQYIARKIIESPYSFEEAKVIDKYEIFPILITNLLQVAGEWAGFNEDWLIEIITSRINRRTKLSDLSTEITYWMFKRMTADYWKKLEIVYSSFSSLKPEE